MNISINPSYFCNFKCDFCYLTADQLKDQKKISANKLDLLLSDVPTIDHIDLYGGEIGALKPDYIQSLFDVIQKHYNGKINIITNLSMFHDFFERDDVSLSVSYDFEARERHDKVFEHMMMTHKDISILILASPMVLNMDVDSMIFQLNMLNNITSVEIKPYSINQANQHNVTHKDFENFVIKWIESPIEKKFDFINVDHIEASLNKEYNAFSDNHVYITPNGKYAVLDFDEHDKELFTELDTYNDYIDWTNKEKLGLSNICNSCKYKGNCLTEHYRYVKDMDNSCNGYYGLLEYYEGLED